MKYLFTLLVSVLFFCFQPFLSESFAQQHTKTGTFITATSTSFALGNSGALHTQLLYNASDLAPVPNNGNITKLWFKRAGTTNVTLTNFNIKLGQTSAASGFTNGALFNTGLTTVFSSTGWTSPSGAANTWFSIDISSFSYDPSFQLIVDLSFSATSNESFTIASTITSGITQNKLYAGSNLLLTGTSSTNWADLGLTFAAPTNDNCASPVLLSPSRNCAKTTTGTTMGANSSFTTPNCGGLLSTSSDDEVWYSFVAEGTGDTVTVTGIGAFDPVIEAFASCGTVSQPSRISCSDATTTGGSETLIFAPGTLTAGNTYRVRVFSYDLYRGFFNICLRNKNAISNDDCNNPIALTGRTSCQPISATTAGATQSLPVSFCGGFTSTAANDVWFSFRAFNPTDSIIVNGQGSLDAVVQILDECSLNGYSRCTDIGGSGLEILSPGDLIPGKTYLVRVYGWNGAEGTFSICHKYFGTPSNDNCTNPLPLQVGATCSYISRNTFNATMDDSYTDCSGLGDDDVWFTFTAPSSQAEINVTQTLFTGTAFFTFNPVIELYGNCNPSSFITCVNTAPTDGTSLETMNLTGLNPGQTYYIRVYHAGNGSGNVGFNICVVNTFCNPLVGKAKIISPLTADVLSNGSVQLGVTGHSGSLVWEYSTDGISFTPDPSLTTDIATFIPKTTTDVKYYFRAKVTDGLCSPKYSDTVSINVRCHSPISFTSLFDGTYISAVSLSDLDRTSTFDPLGGAYQDFRSDTARLCLGGTRSNIGRLKLTISSSVNSYQRMVWVDLNRNGSFGDPGENLHSGSSFASATTNINLLFPSSIEEGVYPMRIAIYSGAFGNGNPDNPCASNLSIPFGEIEEYTLRIYRNPIVNAGADIQVCVPSVQLNALYPGPSHAGTWTVRTGTGLTGEGLIANPHDTNSVVTNLKPGINSFIWTVTGPCGTSSDTVDVTFLRLTANAGTDQVACTSIVFLAATPSTQGSGIWSVLQGSGSFSNQQSATSLAFGPAIGINRYIWTVTGGNCPSVSDTVTIDNRQNPTFANAGLNQTVCGATFTALTANTPTVGTGKWTVISGSGSFTNDTDPNTTVTNLGLGLNSFRWTISNSPCFPTSDDVNVLRLNPVIANAGIDQTICQDTALLVGNDPNDEGISTSWTQIAGTGSIFNVQATQTQVAGLASGINRFVYSIIEPGCPVSRDTVDVDRKIQPGRATTGADQTICSSSTTIIGNNPVVGTGKWTRISGQGTIQNPSSNSTQVTNLGVGANVFRWTISNPPCADRFAEITIFRNTPIPAQAGVDQVICTTFVQMNAVDPAIDGVGISWTQIAGTSSTFNLNSATATFFSLTAGLNRYVYSVTVPGCPASTDTVDITRNLPPTTANAGNNQTVCASNATLAGNTATSGTGKWTRISGFGNITNDANPTSSITGLGLGANVFRWTISNPPCADSFDEVTIIRTSPIIANAGTDQVICTTFVQLTGNVIVGNSGNATWTQIQGTGLIGNPNSASTTVNNLSAGINRFVYSITTPSCPNPSTDTVLIRVNVAQTAQAGPDQSIFTTSTNLAAINPTGIWTRISGTGSIGNSTNPATAVSGLGLGDNVFVWTFNVSPCPVSTDTVIINRGTVPDVCQNILLNAESTGGANAGIDLKSPTNNPFFSFILTYGDGNSNTGTGGNFNGFHAYPNPGIYNVCARLYYQNVFGSLDSCDVCDTVNIPVPASPCTNPVLTASHSTGFQASVDLNSSDNIFTQYRVDFGDGTITNGTGSSAILNHTYPVSGTFRVCGRFYFTNAFQQPDSCEKCDTVNIPLPFNPCDAFSVTNLSVTKTDITEPLSMRGYLYELSDSVSFVAGSIQKVTMRVFDAVTNENQLEGSLIPGTGDSFMSFNLTIPPGQKRICYTGYFAKGNGLDSCSVCYLKNLPAPNFCEFFDLKTNQICRNTVEWKEFFSGQAAPDSVLVDFGDGQSYQTQINGDSGTHTYTSPGTYQLCAFGRNPLAGTNFVPTVDDCKVCKTIVIGALPDAGTDQTICLDNFSQIGSVIPTGYQARWEVLSGSSTLDNSIPANLVATELSAGANLFRYVFYKAGQICPEEADTVKITRVLPILANAGTDQSTFLPSANLAATNPTGSWTKIAGGGLITNSSSSTSSVTGLTFGENIFVWTVSQSPCLVSTDTVIITRNTVPNVCQGISLVAQSTGGANASITLTSPTISSFISNEIAYGDGIFNGGNGGSFSGTHAYPAPGLYNVCAKLYYTNVFLQLDSCEICDTVLIPESVRPCSSLSINASHFGGMNAGVSVLSLNPVFTMHVVSFGDGSLSPVGTGANSNYSHTYSVPGVYNVCAKVYFNDVFQRKDSCEICDTVNIPVPFNPCDSFKVTRISTTKTDVFEPDSLRGYWYSLSDNVSFVAGSIDKVTMRVFDAVTNENQLEGSLIPGSGATFSNFNLTIPPGKKRVCYTGYFVNGQVPDSCTICYTDSLPFPPVCDFFSIDVKQICRNTAKFKVHYSGQSAFDSVWVLVNDEPAFRIPASGDSVNYTFPASGKFKICAIGLKESLDVLRNGPLALDLPGPPCRICDSLDIAPGPDAGLDDTICASVYDRNGFGIPDGYLADWSVESGSATLDLTEPFNLRASNLSAGENKFVYRFFKADQSCPSETDTISIFRVLPLVADAGTDQLVNASSATLAAGNSVGIWSVLTGGATVTNPSNPGSGVTSLGLGANVLLWTVTSNPCSPSSDTVVITRTDACTSLSLTASHTTGFFAKVKPVWPTGGPFFSVKVNFGDGTESTEMTSTDTLSHLFTGQGIYNVCARFLYFNTAQQLDSCIVCDTVNIPEFVSPCDSFGVNVVVVKSVVDVNPNETQGWYYDYAVDLSNTSRFSTTKFRFDDGPLLNVADYGIANTAFSYIQTPSDSLRKLCVIGYYEGPDGKTDSCVVCQQFSNPFPPVCDFLTLNLAPVCRNTADVKVQFSTQSRFDSVWVSINEDSLIHIPASGDSIRLTFTNPGKYKICALANGAASRPLNLDLPGFTCAVCDSINVLPAPDAGNDTTICGSDFSRNGKEVPSGYTGGWLVTQGSGSVSSFSDNNLSATNLSPGLNQFVYRFFSQTCATETDTVNVIRETGDIADAGPDQIICSDTTNMTANAPSGSHSGQWTIVQGTGIFEDATSPVTRVFGLSVGLNKFRWIISNGVCPADSNEIEINRLVPALANAGLDKTVCNDSTFLQASGISGSGFWTLVSGNGTISDNQNPQSPVSNLNVGPNSFVWTTISQICPVTTDQVTITFAPPIKAFGGFDDTVYVNQDTLKGNDPGIGTSKWTKISGSSLVLNPLNPVTVVTDLSIGLNEFVYTVRNPICQTEDKAANADSVTSDTVRIYYFIPVQANAGRDTSICSSNPFQLYGNLPGQGTGEWTILEGSGTIENPADPSSAFTNPGSGTNRLIWSVTTPGLEASTDTITVQVSLPPTQANAGTDKVICETFLNLEGNTPSIGTGTWNVLSGTGTVSNANDPVAGVSNLSFGINLLSWTISNGVCPSRSDSVFIVVSPPLSSDAGIDQTICGDTITLQGSPVPFGATGEWKVAAGAGTFVNPSSATTLVTGLAAGVNSFHWVLKNGVCPADSDFVAITSVASPSAAIAGEDQSICGNSGTLNADPETSGSGLWTVLSGSALIEFPDQFNSSITGLGTGQNLLVWTISNSPCAPSSDTVAITSSEIPVVDAGPNSSTCGDTASLAAVIGIGQSGTWTSILGTGTITNPTSANSGISGITTKINQFVWTIVSGACTASDTVTVTSQFNPLAFGPDKVICEDSVLVLDAGIGFTSYLWNNGSVTQTISIDTAGTYSVSIQTPQGCNFSDTITVIETICTDIDPLLTSKLNWSLYPNPGQGKLFMRLDNAIPGAAHLKVYSNLGVLVFEDAAFVIKDGIEKQVLLPTLPDGVYYLELSGTGYRLKEKLVIRK